MRGLLEKVDLAGCVGALGDLMHQAGAPVTPERSGRLATAIHLARPATVEDLYWLARVTLVSTRADIEIFERVFGQVFRGLLDPADFRGDAAGSPPPGVARSRSHPDRPGEPRAGGTAPEPTASSPGTDRGSSDDARESILAAVSSEERLRRQEFASMTPAELAELRSLMARLSLAAPRRRSRRTVRHGNGAAIDLRASFRRSLRTSGDPVVLVRRTRRTRPRRLVFLCDISGSMEPYGRAYLQLLQSAVGGAHAEAFVFATRLTRLTRVLRETNPAVALIRAGLAAPDWAGGTRIGEAVKAFNDRFGRRGMARNAVIVVVSDGWERDDPLLLGREMERLARLAYRIIWVNPRKAAPGYRPVVGGMAAVLPHVDAFVSGHSLAAIDELLAAIAAP